MAISNLVQVGREAKVFTVQETTAGTQVYPTGTNDFIVPSGAPEFTQNPSYTESTEVRDTRSKRSRFQDMTPAGTWSIPMYCRPNGTRGSVPDGHFLLWAAFGSTTTYAGSSVTYQPASVDNKSLSIYIAMKDICFVLIGATVNEFKATLVNKGAVNFVFSGQFMTMKWAGKGDIASGTNGSITMVAGHENYFTVGQRVKVWDDSDSAFETTGNPYATITDINTTTHVITVSTPGTAPTGTWTTGDYLMYYVPSTTEVGTPAQCRIGKATLGGTDLPIISMDVTMNNGLQYLEDEISANIYPTTWVADQRSVTAATQLYLRTKDLTHFYNSGIQGNTAVQAALTMGNNTVATAGNQFLLSLPQSEGSVPALSGDLQKQIAIDFIGLATTNYNDEIKLTFS